MSHHIDGAYFSDKTANIGSLFLVEGLHLANLKF